MVLTGRIAVEQPAEEGDQRDTLELCASAGILAIIVRAEQGLEAVRIPERLGRQRRDHLAEANVAVGKRFRVAFGSQEDRPDDGRPPTDRHDDDRAHVAHIQRRPCVLQHWIVRRVGDEHRVARLERPLELRIPIEIDDEVPDRWIFVARDQAHIGVSAREIDRAAIEPERFTELAGDRLQNVYEVQRGRNVLKNVDDRDELITLALKLRDPLLQPSGLRSRRGKALDR